MKWINARSAEEPVIDIIDNFLPVNQFEEIRDVIMGKGFPWYKVDVKAHGDDSAPEATHNFQFTHMFYENRKNREGENTDFYLHQSDYFSLIQPIIQELNPVSILRIKANITGAFDSIKMYNMHTDTDFKSRTAVYYMNDNDGKTVFEGGVEVESKANRIAMFDSNLLHTATTHTDTKFRVVININWIPEEMVKW